MIDHFHKGVNPVLSLLICTIPNRRHFLDRLLDILKPQLNDSVEVLINRDDGKKSIGTKRNELIDSVSNDKGYLAFIDDDDTVSVDYCKRILEALNKNPNVDCVGFEGQITFDGNRPRKFIHSIRYKTWFEEGKIFYRQVNHLNPIKREIARKVRFPEINMGEDRDYSERVLKYLHVEEYLSHPPVYFYQFRSKK
jgi:hypothetical protein